MSDDKSTIVKVPRARRNNKKAEEMQKPAVASAIRRSHDHEIQIVNPTEFFNDINKPVQSRLYNFIEELKKTNEEKLDENGISNIIEIEPTSGKWRWVTVNSTSQLKIMVEKSEAFHSKYLKLVENKYRRFAENGFSDAITPNNGALEVRVEYAPLIGTPFFKQMYLYDYWAMHSKCFWYKNYSGLAKMIVDMTRNFVMGKGFNVKFDDEKLQDVWNRYEDYSQIQEMAREWCDELTYSGETMVKKMPTAQGIMHRSFDPSTIWEIVTDPENIHDIKYYHQQYNTQYQLYGDKDVPLSKYIMQQLPPTMVHHTKINVTSYEKRGRSDLLAPLLYFKYYEDFMSSKLTRAKNEAAFIWDVEIDGSEEDVRMYISNAENINNVPAGSENVHNKAVKRTPLSPTFSRGSTQETAQDILSYVAMATSIPVNYMGTFGTGGYTKAGALVATEPVAKKMIERQLKMEHLIRKIVKDVLFYNKLDVNAKFEVNFPEILEEDSASKIQNVYLAQDKGTISKETASYMVAKELKMTKYNYKEEQAKILKDSKANDMFSGGNMDQANKLDLKKPELDKSRMLNRDEVKKDGMKL